MASATPNTPDGAGVEHLMVLSPGRTGFVQSFARMQNTCMLAIRELRM
jgi:hypothetical protein